MSSASAAADVAAALAPEIDLSSRAALAQTVANRLEALGSRQQQDEPPTRAEVRELQADLPLTETAHERIAARVIRGISS